MCMSPPRGACRSRWRITGRSRQRPCGRTSSNPRTVVRWCSTRAFQRRVCADAQRRADRAGHDRRTADARRCALGDPSWARSRCTGGDGRDGIPQQSRPTPRSWRRQRFRQDVAIGFATASRRTCPRSSPAGTRSERGGAPTPRRCRSTGSLDPASAVHTRGERVSVRSGDRVARRHQPGRTAPVVPRWRGTDSCGARSLWSCECSGGSMRLRRAALRRRRRRRQRRTPCPGRASAHEQPGRRGRQFGLRRHPLVKLR